MMVSRDGIRLQSPNTHPDQQVLRCVQDTGSLLLDTMGCHLPPARLLSAPPIQKQTRQWALGPTAGACGWVTGLFPRFPSLELPDRGNRSRLLPWRLPSTHPPPSASQDPSFRDHIKVFLGLPP